MKLEALEVKIKKHHQELSVLYKKRTQLLVQEQARKLGKINDLSTRTKNCLSSSIYDCSYKDRLDYETCISNHEIGFWEVIKNPFSKEAQEIAAYVASKGFDYWKREPNVGIKTLTELSIWIKLSGFQWKTNRLEDKTCQHQSK